MFLQQEVFFMLCHVSSKCFSSNILLTKNVCVNRILVPDYGFMNLQLIPMLVGFFTYKIATFFQAIEEALPGARENPEA